MRCTRAIVSSVSHHWMVCLCTLPTMLVVRFIRVHQRNSQRLRFSVALDALLSTFDNVVVYAQT